MTALLHRATLRLAQHRPADAIADFTDLLTPMPANVAAVIRADINADELDRLLSN
jgi:hypothetical protein